MKLSGISTGQKDSRGSPEGASTHGGLLKVNMEILKHLGRLREYSGKIQEIIGNGTINTKIRVESGITVLHVTIDRPDGQLKEIASMVQDVLPILNLPGITVKLEVKKDGQKLIKEISAGR